MWRTGLAGAIVSGIAMSLATAFLFAAVQRPLKTQPPLRQPPLYSAEPELALSRLGTDD